MVDTVAKQDVMVLVRQALASVSQWFNALDGLLDNPVYMLVRRGPYRSPAQTWGERAWTYLPPATTGVILYYLVVTNRLALLHANPDPLTYSLLSAALLLFTTWLISGWYKVAYSALALISEPGTLGRGDLQLDEGLLATRVTSYDLVLGMICGIGARAMPYLAGAALSVPVMVWCFSLSSGQIEGPSWLGQLDYLVDGSYNISTRVLVYGIFSALFLLLLSMPGGFILLAWLLALGRNLRQRWQLQLVAASTSLAQVVWLPLALFTVYTWFTNINEPSRSDDVLLIACLAPFLSIILLVLAMIASQRWPSTRTLVVTLLPWWLVVIALTSTTTRLAEPQFQGATLRSDLLLNLTWITSSLSLINPLTIPFKEWMGLPSDFPLLLKSFDWFRLPVILLMQLVLIALCAAVARLAVGAWRQHEE